MKLKMAWSEAATGANRALGKESVDLVEFLTATGQMGNPQAKVLVEVVEKLKGEGLLEEAYLRGSFGRGHGDIKSDVDLFTVVNPENLEKVYETVKGHLAARGGVVVDCHDRLVEDYGGIGFMFIAKNEEYRPLMYQFDLYMAVKGVAPVKPFNIQPRIYSRDPSYKWMEEYGNPRDENVLPESAKAFIHKHVKGDEPGDRMELMMQEMLLTLFMTNKHIERQQTSRLVVDNQAIVSSAVEMLQSMTSYTSNGYSAIYLGNEIVNFCRKYGDEEMVVAADKLDKLFTQQMDKKKLRDVVSYCRFVLEKSFPAKYAGMKDVFDLFERDILTTKEHGARHAPAKRQP